MSGVARVGVDAAGGTQMGGGNHWVFCENTPIVVVGDKVVPHGSSPHGKAPPRMAEGSGFVFIDGIPICRAGDRASCGHGSSGSSFMDSE